MTKTPLKSSTDNSLIMNAIVCGVPCKIQLLSQSYTVNGNSFEYAIIKRYTEAEAIELGLLKVEAQK